MKTLFTCLTIAIMIASCNDKTAATTTESTTTENTKDTSAVNYVYTIEHPDQWVAGSKLHTENVLKSLQAFEMGDMDKAVTYFADTVKLEFDGFDATMSRDSLAAFFKLERSKIVKIDIIMQDFESVKSKDTQKEYVSLWYKQIMQDKKGKTDSIECMDDLEIKNGKIVLLNEKIRRLPITKR